MMYRFLWLLLFSLITSNVYALTAEEMTKMAATTKPEARQLAWQECEFTCFIHFGVNTFSGREWGNGKEGPRLFNPTDLDTDQWCRTMKAAGMKLVVFTAKHHDGFCLWQTRYTKQSVASSPWRKGKGDVLRDLAKSCQKYGIKLGVYLSPADLFQLENKNGLYGNGSTYTERIIPRPVKGRPFANKRTFTYKVDDYNEYCMNQLFELLTEYGPIHEVWFDGAHPKRKGGQTYTYNQWYEMIHALAPEAVIAVKGKDVRWCGNEGGRTRKSEWSVIPIGGSPANWREPNATASDLGSMDRIKAVLNKGGFLRWYPAETNTSIRHGWFWRNEQQGVKSIQQILDVWYRSVGGNSVFLLNVPPDNRGHFGDRDVKVLKAVGSILKDTFAVNLARKASVTASSSQKGFAAANVLDGNTATCWMPTDSDTERELILTLDGKKTFNRIMLQEQVRDYSQRIVRFALDAQQGGKWKEIVKDTVVGYKRISRIPTITTSKIRVRILESRLNPTISTFGLYYEKLRLAEPSIRRDKDGMVSISSTPGHLQMRFTIDGSEPTLTSQLFTQPIAMMQGGLVKARAVDGRRLGPITEMQFDICKGKWKIINVSSEQKSSEPGRYAIDDNPDTLWHTRWSPDQPKHPHHITIDLGEMLTIKGFTYLPRNKVLAGTIDKYEFYVSKDGKKWGSPSSAGRFDNIKNNAVEQRVMLDKTESCRYIKLVGLHAADGKPFMSAAEVGVIIK